MFPFFNYIRYSLSSKTWFWLLLFLAFESGAVSKYVHSHPLWEVLLNAGLGLISLGIFLRLLRRKQTEVLEEKSKNGRLILIFTIAGGLSGIAITPYLMATQLEQQSSVSFSEILVSTAFSVACMTWIASTIGLSLSGKVGLDAPLLRKWVYEGKRLKLSKKWVLVAIFGGLIGALLITFLDISIFQPNLPKLQAAPRIALWKSFLSVFYGGIVEEVLLRLFLMTLLVWVLTRFQKSNHHIPSYIYLIAIVLSAFLFGLGHLPATASYFGGLTPLLIFRALISNGLLGIFFGYLYWKKGLEYAILSHLSADLFLHVIFPWLFTV